MLELGHPLRSSYQVWFLAYTLFRFPFLPLFILFVKSSSFKWYREGDVDCNPSALKINFRVGRPPHAGHFWSVTKRSSLPRPRECSCFGFFFFLSSRPHLKKFAVSKNLASQHRSLSLFSFSPLSSTWPTPTPPMTTTTTTEATTAAGGRTKGRSSTSKSGLTSRKTTAACRPTDGRCRQRRRQSRVKNDFISGAGWRMVLKGFNRQA